MTIIFIVIIKISILFNKKAKCYVHNQSVELCAAREDSILVAFKVLIVSLQLYYAELLTQALLSRNLKDLEVTLQDAQTTRTRSHYFILNFFITKF